MSWAHNKAEGYAFANALPKTREQMVIIVHDAIREAVSEAAKQSCVCPGGSGYGADHGHYVMCGSGRVLAMLDD